MGSTCKKEEGNSWGGPPEWGVNARRGSPEKGDKGPRFVGGNNRSLSHQKRKNKGSKGRISSGPGKGVQRAPRYRKNLQSGKIGKEEN